MINYDLFHNMEIRGKYKEEAIVLLFQLPLPDNNQERLENVVSSTTNAALNILGTKTKTNKVANPEIKTLSISQHLKLERENTTDPVKREILPTKRNKTMTNKIHQLVKKEETDRIEKQLENIESMKNDSSQMFQAIKDLTWCPQEFQIKISGHFQDISGQKFCFSRTFSTSGKPQRKS